MKFTHKEKGSQWYDLGVLSDFRRVYGKSTNCSGLW